MRVKSQFHTEDCAMKRDCKCSGSCAQSHQKGETSATASNCAGAKYHCDGRISRASFRTRRRSPWDKRAQSRA